MTQSEQEMMSSPAAPRYAPHPAAASPQDPSRTLGIVGFVLSFFAIANIAGLIISIIALVRAKRAGFKNGFAVAGTVIASAGLVFTIVMVTILGSTLIGAAQTCAELGVGVHTVGPATYSCTPTFFYVNYGTTSLTP